jgi:hypothetical protein
MTGMSDQQPHVVIVSPGGGPVPASGEEAGDRTDSPASAGHGVVSMVQEPAKVMRIGSMIKQLLDEVKSAPLDEASRVRMREIHQTSISELEDGLAPQLREELRRISLPFSDDQVPSEAELRIAQAQLVGWLEGLFHGMQTALLAQMAARGQVDDGRRRALPGAPGETPDGQVQSTGQYL